MRSRHDSAAFLGVEIERAARVEKTHEFLAAAHRAPARDHERPLRLRDDLRRARHVGGGRRNAPRRLGREVFLQHDTGRHDLAQHVGGDFDVNRSGRVAVADRDRPCLVEVAQDAVGAAQRARRARHGPHDRYVVDALQRSQVVLWDRRAAADQHHRHALERSIGDGADAVRHARTRGGEGDADFTGEHCVAMRHVHARAFVANVDDAHLALREVIPDRLDMATLQPVNALRASGHDELGDPFGHRLALMCTHVDLA